jgi:hypothetical protein
MAYETQTKLVGEIADLVREYRNDGTAFVKFGLKCGLALNKLPVACGIMVSPKRKDERFQISDPAFREKYPTENDAFHAAFDQFAALGQFLAWNGKAPKEGRFDLVGDMSENFTRPTMQVEVIYRRRGQEHEERLSMFFIGFDSDAEAAVYATRHAAQVK